MAKFTVSVGRDATVYYEAVVEAESLEEVKSHMGRHGYEGPIIGDWVETSLSVFDEAEVYRVRDVTGEQIYHSDDEV